MRMRERTVPLSPEPLLFTPVNIGSSRNSSESHFTLRVVLFLHRGTFLHAFYFISITTHEHTITLCCGAQKNRLIEANYLSNEDTFKMIHCCSTLLHIYDIYLLGSRILGPSHE